MAQYKFHLTIYMQQALRSISSQVIKYEVCYVHSQVRAPFVQIQRLWYWIKQHTNFYVRVFVSSFNFKYINIFCYGETEKITSRNSEYYCCILQKCGQLCYVFVLLSYFVYFRYFGLQYFTFYSSFEYVLFDHIITYEKKIQLIYCKRHENWFYFTEKQYSLIP